MVVIPVYNMVVLPKSVFYIQLTQFIKGTGQQPVEGEKVIMLFAKEDQARKELTSDSFMPLAVTGRVKSVNVNSITVIDPLDRGRVESVDISADGQIALGKDAQVEIWNRSSTPVLPVSTTVSGVKILKGRAMRAGEFVFVMEPVNLAGEVVGEAMTSASQAGESGEETLFTFAPLTYDYQTYKNAAYRDADGSALFYYVVREQISEDADAKGYDANQRLIYDLSQYLVVVRVSLDKQTKELTVRQSAFPYEGGGVPATLRPNETGGRILAAR